MDDILVYPYKTLAQSGYKPNMSYKSLIIVLYFGYTLKTKYRNPMIFIYFFPCTPSNWKPFKIAYFQFSKFKNFLLTKISSLKKRLVITKAYITKKG